MNAAQALHQAGPQIAALSGHIRAVAGGDDEAWLDTLDGETDAIAVARIVVRQIIEARAQASALKEVKADFGERQARIEAREDRLRGALLRFMQEIGERALPLPEATVSIAAGQQAVVGDVDGLPDEFMRIKREPDRVKIKEALQRGERLPRVFLTNAEPRLTVRVK